jgi:hypothetical protein
MRNRRAAAEILKRIFFFLFFFWGMKNYRCFFFLYMGSTTWLAHDNAGICRTQASNQASKAKHEDGD